MSDLRIVDPADLEPEREAIVAGILLAAGTSSRFGGENKLLAEVEGVPIVRRAALSLLESSVDGVAVVLGFEADRVRDALVDLDVSYVENPDFEAGQSTSVAAGIAAARGTDAAVFALGDMPFVSPSSVDDLIAAYRAGAGDALAAAHEGERGNPVLFDARFYDDLADVDGDVGGREILLESDRSALVETGDPGIRRDVDTRADLEALR